MKIKMKLKIKKIIKINKYLIYVLIKILTNLLNFDLN